MSCILKKEAIYFRPKGLFRQPPLVLRINDVLQCSILSLYGQFSKSPVLGDLGGKMPQSRKLLFSRGLGSIKNQLQPFCGQFKAFFVHLKAFCVQLKSLSVLLIPKTSHLIPFDDLKITKSLL
jgi:hypothetical protein